jgi:hypothetical protein
VRHVLEFAVLAAVLIAIAGPSVLFTVSRALTVGRRLALFTVAGNELGGCVQVAAVAFGGNLHGREGGWSYPGPSVRAGHRRPRQAPGSATADMQSDTPDITLSDMQRGGGSVARVDAAQR